MTLDVYADLFDTDLDAVVPGAWRHDSGGCWEGLNPSALCLASRVSDFLRDFGTAPLWSS